MYNCHQDLVSGSHSLYLVIQFKIKNFKKMMIMTKGAVRNQYDFNEIRKRKLEISDRAV